MLLKIKFKEKRALELIQFLADNSEHWGLNLLSVKRNYKSTNKYVAMLDVTHRFIEFIESEIPNIKEEKMGMNTVRICSFNSIDRYIIRKENHDK